jgi:hypothetical protein
MYVHVYIYLWNNDYNCQWIFVDANHYYETSLYEVQQNQQNPKWGKYKLVSHGYLAHEGEKSQGNVVMYHHYDIPMSK